MGIVKVRLGTCRCSAGATAVLRPLGRARAVGGGGRDERKAIDEIRALASQLPADLREQVLAALARSES